MLVTDIIHRERHYVGNSKEMATAYDWIAPSTFILILADIKDIDQCFIVLKYLLVYLTCLVYGTY